MTKFDSILLIGFGGPQSLADVGPFLKNVVGGRPIPKERLDAVKEHYRLVGGRSPYNELTLRQAHALETLLKQEGPHLPVYVGMRNWEPTLETTLRKMTQAGHQNAIGFVLAPHRSQASWQRYLDAVKMAQEKIGPNAPRVSTCPAWHTHPLFIKAVAEKVQEAKNHVNSKAHRIYTAHSIPVRMAQDSQYETEITQTAQAVNALLGKNDGGYSVCYQSRSGHPHEPWLGPDIKELVEELSQKGTKDVTVIPIGFLVDHMEVVYDLDIETCEWCKKLGVGFTRAGTVSDNSNFIQMIKELVKKTAASLGS